jgi:hypothetical protein
MSSISPEQLKNLIRELEAVGFSEITYSNGQLCYSFFGRGREGDLKAFIQNAIHQAFIRADIDVAHWPFAITADKVTLQ